MGINIKKLENEKITYDLVPEYVPISTIDAIKDFRDINSETNGMNKEKSMRHIGKIPYEVLYNYALSHNIPPTEIMSYFTHDNGKKLIKLLKEFPVFKTVDKPL